MTPSPYVFVLLALAAYRVWHLVALDDVAWRLRRWLVGYDPRIEGPARIGVAEFIQCPWCLGFWVAVAWFAVWWAWHDAVVVAAVFAASAIVGLIEDR